ncbi:MAG: HEAT repeat domain-containing protein [Planctomycetes bacterium]|nr:HEAT repeat domain-containing protein [Planctomycetota bacterium]
MVRSPCRVYLSLLVGLLWSLNRGHDITSAAQADPQPVASIDQPTAAHLESLDLCREGILDDESRPVERRRWAEQLFSYRSDSAKALTIELLRLPAVWDVQLALCEVIVDLSRTHPDRLNVGLLEPLVDLLDSDEGDLRSAAALALAGFPDPGVPRKLGSLAAQGDLSIRKRLAAIDALAPNIHRREVVEQLISLLDVGIPEITQQVAASLEPASRESFGSNTRRWRDWWQQKRALSQEAWLADQTQIYRWRLRTLEARSEACLAEAQRRESAITQRLQGFQRDVFRTLTAEQKEQKLVEWLSDPLGEVALTAASIIKAHIADEGQRPTDEVLTALLSLLRSGQPATRREVLLIVQNLHDPVVVREVLAQLEVEQDPMTRHAILKAIGKLNDAQAVPALLREIASPESLPACVREAAIALSKVALKANDQEWTSSAVSALKERYAETPQEEHGLRAALLSAMAGVGDASFADEFLLAVESDEAALLRPAIRGLEAIGDRSKLARLRDHVAHADPLVRLGAVEAVGHLGREDADLECLLPRLNPTHEGDELVREAAWEAVRTLLKSRPIARRIEAAQRLRDLPELEIAYLQDLAESLSNANGDVANLEIIHQRLATVRLSRGEYAEATVHLRELYQIQRARPDEVGLETGLRWLDAALRGFPQQDVAEVIKQLSPHEDAPIAARIIERVEEYIQPDESRGTLDRDRALLSNLKTVPADRLPDRWRTLLEEWESRLNTSERIPPSESQP